MDQVIVNVRKAFTLHTDEKARQAMLRFFKEPIDCYGMKSAVVEQISKENFKTIKGYSKKEIFDICEILWHSPKIEENMLACSWSYNLKKSFEPNDFELFKFWINNYVNNWATCDTFCNRNMGDLILKYPDFLSELKKFTKSDNRWMKRAAAVSLIVPARKGLFLSDMFEIALILLEDPDDMVQKGYGWMLKVASQTHQNEVFEFVMQHKQRMPRTALRYAIEKMPEDLKKQAMSK
ncbi:MAG TPA: DNA alkylation repair protein [Bacteroidales bacterium]|nr:DNA alkylation repair protein [Bacteroidales bacterium]